MKTNWRTKTITLSAAVVLLSACGAGFDASEEDGFEDYAGEEQEEDVAEHSGVIVGTTWQALSYPTCSSPNADPDGDGWGWEYNRSCVVNKSGTPTCFSPFSDPDRDGWGFEYNRVCKVAGATPTTPTTPTSPPTSSTTCANHEGTASTMAALAVSAATELKRWQPTRDFAIGKIGSEDALVLTAAGKARCSDGVCANTQALLDFQKNEASGKVMFPGNVSLNSGALRSRMVAKFRDQLGCEMQPSNGGTTNCPVEEHTLTFQRSEKGGCDTNFFFVAKKPDGKPLQYPAQLKNKLQWADKTNPYIGFQSVGEVVSIDPTYGLNEANSTTTGSCMNACVRITRSNAAGQCCSCAGKTKAFKKSAWSGSTFLCQ
jgi:hypothetical protein